MICTRCRKKIDARGTRCPNCGKSLAGTRSGVFQTSAVLISSAGADLVYRSMDDVPDPLRTQLLKSTNSPNSATILIADQRGRREIARAMRSLGGAVPRGTLRSVLSGEIQSDSPSEPSSWLTPRRRKIALALIVLLCLALVAFVFLHRW